MNIQIDHYTFQGSRGENEDSLAVERLSEHAMYAVVADGLGGHGGGKTASALAVNALRQSAEQTRLPTGEEIQTLLGQANDQILKRRNGPDHMKTTVVFLAVQGNQAVWAHIGDSRLYHYYEGELADFTLDHSMCQMAVKLGEITRADIPGHPDRSRILRVLGEPDFKPEIHVPVYLQRGRHAFLLCTDGLWERLMEDEIGLDLQKSNTPGEWLDFLRRRAEKRKWNNVDNNSAVAVFIEE